ncbi:MAG: ROK family protein [Coriobacteriia bacterium]
MRANLAVGVDVGGTRIAAGLVERKGKILKSTKRLTPGNGPFTLVDAIADMIEEVSAGTHSGEIAGIGIGVPGQIDFLRQSIEFCTNLPLEGVDVRSLVMSRTKREVTIDNDGHMAAFGEARWGAAKGARDFIMITVGTGVGGGLFLNGEPYRGSRGLGGEIGHVVMQLDGPPCPCGGRGHLEAFLGRPALGARGREAAGKPTGAAILKEAGGDLDAVTAECVLQASLKGDAVAKQILCEVGEILGRALVGFVNVFNPKLVLIGGGVGESSPELVKHAQAAMAAEALAGRRDVEVRQAVLGNNAGILGAAGLAFDEHDLREGLHR